MAENKYQHDIKRSTLNFPNFFKHIPEDGEKYSCQHQAKRKHMIFDIYLPLLSYLVSNVGDRILL